MDLIVSDLCVARAGLPVLDGVNFTVPQGTCLVLRGPNGVGKTTLLRSLAGLQPAVSGSISVTEDQAAYASHADGVKASLTVAENLTFWAEIYGRPMPEDIFDLFDIADLRDRPAGTLSAGQKRRLGLARLGVIDRRVLFLDEPTVSLDRFSVRLFADFLRGRHLAKGGIAVVATHIDLGLEAPELDLTQFQSLPGARSGRDEAFL